MALNEAETGLHTDLPPALARLIIAASEQSQLIVVSHARILIESLSEAPQCKQLHLEKTFGETILSDATLFNRPNWQWPSR